MASKNKTFKKLHTSDISQDAFQLFLNSNAEEAFNRPWHKLERGLRLNRLRLFIDAEKARANYTDDEVKQLNAVIMKAFDKKMLNTKNVVVYNEKTTQIEEIKGLVMHRGADGKMLFQILEKKTGVTFRKSRTASNSGEIIDGSDKL
jgi:hypothetical protein